MICSSSGAISSHVLRSANSTMDALAKQVMDRVSPFVAAIM